MTLGFGYLNLYIFSVHQSINLSVLWWYFHSESCAPSTDSSSCHRDSRVVCSPTKYIWIFINLILSGFFCQSVCLAINNGNWLDWISIMHNQLWFLWWEDCYNHLSTRISLSLCSPPPPSCLLGALGIPILSATIFFSALIWQLQKNHHFVPCRQSYLFVLL